MHHILNLYTIIIYNVSRRVNNIININNKIVYYTIFILCGVIKGMTTDYNRSGFCMCCLYHFKKATVDSFNICIFKFIML